MCDKKKNSVEIPPLDPTRQHQLRHQRQRDRAEDNLARGQLLERARSIRGHTTRRHTAGALSITRLANASTKVALATPFSAVTMAAKPLLNSTVVRNADSSCCARQ